MPETNFYAGIASALLDKYAEPIVKGLTAKATEEWEKFKIDFDLAFSIYLKKSVEKYGKIKTILYRTEPKNLYDFFECPNLRKERGKAIKGDSIDNLLDISNFLIIQGTGGIGKSTLLKYLFLDEVSKKGWIPVLVELKDLNLVDGEYEISDFIFQKLYDLGSTINNKYMEYALQSGKFIFLLDGYDEIASDRKDIFFRKLDSFCDRYSDNCYIISSRPYSEFVEFQRFSVLTLCELSKKQAISLVQKIEFDTEIKNRFLTALENCLYEQHRSFASNPLLLNIMLLTFDNYAEIPEKLHLFYANAFDTLYSKHDATKSGYRRELRCPLSYDSFKKVFAYFCFSTYYQGKIELSCDDLFSILKKIGSTVTPFNPEDYAFDLTNSICVLYRDGLDYKFTHRSFQEYFAAIFLKELSDNNMKKMGMELVKKDYHRASYDGVFPMLRDMAEQRFEQNILLPLVDEFERECVTTDKYAFYFEKIAPVICFDSDLDKKGGINLLLLVNFDGTITGFLYNMTRLYINRTQEENKLIRDADNKLKTFFIKNRGYNIGEQIETINYMNDKEAYALIRDSWVGEMIFAMSSLKETLEQRQKVEELDLSCLLMG